MYRLDPSGERDHVTHTFISGLGKKSSTSIIPYNLNMEPIEAALAFLGPYEPGKKYRYATVAKRFDCSRPTLSKRHRGVQNSRKVQYEKLQLLQPEQEEFLVKYINGLTRRALPPSKEMIRNFAREISAKEVGKHWAERFIARHGSDLITR
jgi:hypothetical protein